MLRGLQARIEKLKAQRPKQAARAHRFIQDGESYDSARARYEREAGITIMPEDFVIVRVIVDLPAWPTLAEGRPT